MKCGVTQVYFATTLTVADLARIIALTFVTLKSKLKQPQIALPNGLPDWPLVEASFPLFLNITVNSHAASSFFLRFPFSCQPPSLLSAINLQTCH